MEPARTAVHTNRAVSGLRLENLSTHDKRKPRLLIGCCCFCKQWSILSGVSSGKWNLTRLGLNIGNFHLNPSLEDLPLPWREHLGNKVIFHRLTCAVFHFPFVQLVLFPGNVFFSVIKIGSLCVHVKTAITSAHPRSPIYILTFFGRTGIENPCKRRD